MEKILVVENLCKEYPKFKLNNVSFSMDKGSIMGFIGRNGAGKTTTLKCLLNLVHEDSGKIQFFGLNFNNSEKEIKQRIGYAAGGINYYQRKKIKDIIAITKSFYPNWDDNLYHSYLKRFSLDEEKKLIELSEGMKVKFNLAIALSHHAELLILDEPTSGLDPVSRDDLLEVFLDLADDGVSILFSTHITSDLDKCADSITYIQNGEIIASDKITNFVNSYRLLNVTSTISEEQRKAFIGVSRNKDGSTALIKESDSNKFKEFSLAIPDLQTIMIHFEKEVN
ncbi:ABC transporter ATP-binding protein [Clostridium sp. HCS.1]|uniref:ABC transporter ATP-binding protein n=1 Tax=Clostridium sp. HCS.1 TaxID=3238594 RepID=UPI003A0FFE83